MPPIDCKKYQQSNPCADCDCDSCIEEKMDTNERKLEMKPIEETGYRGLDSPKSFDFPKHIIELAIEGGFDPQFKTRRAEALVCDPLFWKSLGKSLGWSGLYYCSDGKNRGKNWRVVALEFYDLILTSQPTDKFWEELAKDN